MAKAHCCDNCGKLIMDSNVRVVLTGYDVIHNEDKSNCPKGFMIRKPEDFCSFICLSEWAKKEQQLLDDYHTIVAERFMEKGMMGNEGDEIPRDAV